MATIIINRFINKFFAAILIVCGMGCLQSLKAQVVPTSGHTAPPPTSVSNPYKPSAYPSNQKVNYIRTWVARQPYATDWEMLDANRTPDQLSMNTEYIDGFGRVIQAVEWQSSPTGKDIVLPRVYDQFGREQYTFISYASPSSAGVIKTDPFGEQSTFYGSTYPAEQPAYQNEKLYYTMTEFESSPQNRVLASYLAGNSWVGSNRKTATQYLLNNPDDQVQVWNIALAPLAIPTTTVVYNPGRLSKSVTTSENGSQVITFTDVDGHLLLKKVQAGTVSSTNPYNNWLCTYYVHDDLGLLRFVIPPKAVATMLSAGNWTLTSDIINELCFRYEYDDRSRMIAQKVPGAGWSYMVYDQMDHLVYSQDANMRINNQWLGMKYDNLDRVVESGMLTYAGNQAGLQAYVNNNTGKIILSGQAVNGNVSPGTSLPDLIVPVRQAGQALYTAYYSITFEPGFESETGAGFETQLVAPGGGAVTAVVMGNDNPVPSGYSYVPLTYSYFDNYSFTSRTYNTANNGKLDKGNNTYAEPLPASATVFTKGLSTGSKIRVIENATDLSQGKWLETVTFYDNKGHAIQQQSDNYKDGIDYKTSLYDFSGNLLCSYLVHNNPAAGVSNFRVKTNWEFDHAGRVKLIKKTLNDDASKTRLLVYNEYDALGKLKTRKLGQKTDMTGNPITISDPATDNTNWLETDSYAYNIQGWLKGINWNYATGPTSSLVNYQDNKWFGMDLSYDWGFGTVEQYNGNISGQRWVSAGDKKERAYGYSYDPASRLLKADFTQNFGGGTSPNWTTADPNSNFRINFSIKMGDNQTNDAYDANGNIKRMQQWGLQLNTSKVIDDLLYKYEKNEVSNKLQYVTDQTGTADNKLGDFTDNNSADDFGYDLNGNMITNLDKRISGNTGIDQTTGGAIVYNYLNRPWKINIKNTNNTDKGSITYIYDAAGNRLEKRVKEEPAAYNNNTAKTTTVSYMSGFVYSDNNLQYFSHEHGKVRPGPNSQQPYVYDYFLADHLGNTRMVLTDEQLQNTYPVATLENNAAALTIEQGVYNINTANIVNNTSIPGFTDGAGNPHPANVYYNNNGNPPYNTNNQANTGAQSARMYKLNGATGDKTGLGMALKVMTGDQVNIWARSYYHTNGANPNNTYTINATTAALANFLSAFAGTQPLLDKGIAGSALNGSPVTPTDVNNWLNSVPVPSSVPKAYINWILFDEQFRPVTSNCGFDPVHSTTDQLKFHQQTVTISQSGYLYVYCSNESDINVYFDNLQVVLNRGPELEETHYYPYGLAMAGISASAANKPENTIKYNGKELNHNEFTDGVGLEEYDFGARFYNPQIGRWSVVDPLSSKNRRWSPYNYAYNNPLRFIDPDGMDARTDAIWRSAGFSQDSYGNTSWNPDSDLGKYYSGNKWFTDPLMAAGVIGVSIFIGEAADALLAATTRTAIEAGATIEEVNLLGVEAATQMAEARTTAMWKAYGEAHPSFAPLADARGIPVVQKPTTIPTIIDDLAAPRTYTHIGQYMDDLYTEGALGEEAILFRGDTRSPSVVFENNFVAKGTNEDLWDHIIGELGNSAYIPTSRFYGVADGYGGKNGFSYLIDNPGGGFDINSLIFDNPNTWESEISFKHMIHSQNIIGAYPINNPATFIPNPGYTGVLDTFFKSFIK
jgi:RHS repeat-associated protein